MINILNIFPIFSGLFATLAFLMALGTFVDVWQQVNPYPILAISKDDNKESKLIQILKAFSINANGRKIVNTEVGGTDHLGCLSGIRVISMSWIILGHMYTSVFSTPSENKMAAQEVNETFLC